MRVVAALFSALALLSAADAPSIPHEEYRARRAELRKNLHGTLILFGAKENDDLRDTFYQEPNFLYLTGWREPGAALLMTPTEEIILLPPRNIRLEAYYGRSTDPADKDATEKTGFEQTLPRAALESRFVKMSESGGNVYALPDEPQIAKLMGLVPLHERRDANRVIGPLRLAKSPAEISLIREATDATVAAHLAAWAEMKPGLFEYQIAAKMVETYVNLGCERSSYAPIVGSGPNSTVLHYSANRRQIEDGDVVVMDVGAEYAGYASDVTRTVPANGHFTARQREVYDIVLAAQQAAIAAVKPGMIMRGRDDDPKSLHGIAYRYINTHGKDLHGEALGKYFVHGLGHHVGLEVHDPDGYDTPLAEGMVITIEPGIYIPEENLGVRIEDTLLVTKDGAEVLSSALPKSADQVESRLSAAIRH